MINDKTFAASSLVGFSSGVSQYTKSDNSQTIQQVKNTQESANNIPGNPQVNNLNKRKVIEANADTNLREENVSFSKSLSNIGELLQTNGTKLSFNIDITSGNSAKQPVVIVTDRESGNVIRQIPTEEVQRFAEQLSEIESGATSTRGLVLDRQA
jgi:flagellar protein FlaG